MGWEIASAKLMALLAQEPPDVTVDAPENAQGFWIWLVVGLFFAVVIAWLLRTWHVGRGKSGPWTR